MPDRLQPQVTGLENLTVKSSLLIFLRALYQLMLPCGVYLREGHEPIFVTKEQLVTLVELGKSESLVSDIPALAEAGLLRPIGGTLSDQDNALVININGARVCVIRDVLNPPAPMPPEWWDAPLPFAMCAGVGASAALKLNTMAIQTFGQELERLRVVDLPQKDEFIVELEGRDKPSFLTFRRLPSRPGEAVVFILDDCTGDLAEAQDISWWAAVGRTWVASIESKGGTWQRTETEPSESDGKSTVVMPCEWQGRFMGYLYIDGASPLGAETSKSKRTRSSKSTAKKSSTSTTKKKSTTATKTTRKRKTIQETAESEQEALNLKEDTLIQELSPQTMALLSAGQDRDINALDDFDDDFDDLDEFELKSPSQSQRTRTGGDGLDQLA